MGRYDFKPLRVHQHAKQCLDSGKYKTPPCWYHVVGKLTPSQTLVRPQPAQHPVTYSRIVQGPNDKVPQLVETQAPRRKVKTKKASRIFQPVEIRYEEDELRREFFGHHPWELARPRIVLENDGRDYLGDDWSNMKQVGKRLSGERYLSPTINVGRKWLKSTA
jgi:small subunit ribosomal protein S23